MPNEGVTLIRLYLDIQIERKNRSSWTLWIFSISLKIHSQNNKNDKILLSKHWNYLNINPTTIKHVKKFSFLLSRSQEFSFGSLCYTYLASKNKLALNSCFGSHSWQINELLWRNKWQFCMPHSLTHTLSFRLHQNDNFVFNSAQKKWVY